ncbi:MAG TPA: phytanoyl-CoA dioxygenase family protein [Terriglobales bacterium]|nr:phytanoyl-CoA dioxygenase family protein [Terriglobales bacterium]
MDPTSKSFAEIAQKLLDQNRLPPERLKSRLEQALDPDYWRSLSPDLHIDVAPRTDMEPAPASDEAIDHAIASVRDFGYFKMPPVISSTVLRQMVIAVEKLAAEDWPAPFTFVYDEFWQLSRTSTARRILEGVLGRSFKQNSNVWTHHVHPHRGSSGWHPHIDGLQEPAGRLSLWIPLTDATLDNGCMYVIPRDRMSSELLTKYLKRDSLDRIDAEQMLQASYALPASAGSLLGWGFDVMHWGSVCTGEFPPRISIALEFLADGASTFPDELPLLDGAAAPPAFAERVRSIASGIVKYSKFEPLVARYKDLASQIVG